MKSKKSPDVGQVIESLEKEQSLIEALDNKSKEQHSKNSIFSFFVIGLILIIVDRQPLLSFKSIIFFVLGMFLVSLLSIPSYLFKSFLARRINEKQAIMLKNFYWIFELGYDFLITKLLFRLFFGY